MYSNQFLIIYLEFIIDIHPNFKSLLPNGELMYIKSRCESLFRAVQIIYLSLDNDTNLIWHKVHIH